MAIAINGSGTVTGISVGGLPDSIVDDGTLANDAVTLAKMASGTDGQIITYDASGNPSAVGPGTDGQALTSTGAGSPPAFEAISATTPPEACIFQAVPDQVLNITGQNETYTCAFNGEVSDVGSNFNTTTYTFTAPSTGKYLLTANVHIHGIDSGGADDLIVAIATSNREYVSNITGSNLPWTEYAVFVVAVADMDASDTSTVYMRVKGNTGTTADFKAGSRFGGFKIA